jgi:uncharacterized membrane protein
MKGGSTMRSRVVTAPALALGSFLALAGCGPQGAVGSASAALAVPVNFRATGTEPFWGMRVVGSDVRYSTPEIPEEVARHVVRSSGAGGESVSGMLGQVSFRLSVRAERCSDGMSDRVYPFVARLQIGERQLGGCAAAE